MLCSSLITVTQTCDLYHFHIFITPAHYFLLTYFLHLFPIFSPQLPFLPLITFQFFTLEIISGLFISVFSTLMFRLLALSYHNFFIYFSLTLLLFLFLCKLSIHFTLNLFDFLFFIFSLFSLVCSFFVYLFSVPMFTSFCYCFLLALFFITLCFLSFSPPLFQFLCMVSTCLSLLQGITM